MRILLSVFIAGSLCVARTAAANGVAASTDTTAPTITIVTPATGTTVSGTVGVTVLASDNVGITRVQYFVDGALAATVTTPPFSWSWNTRTLANGPHFIQAKAFDAANNEGDSQFVDVTVFNSSSNAQFVSQSVPTVMSVGETYLVSVTMKNTGATTWTSAAGDELVSQNPPNNATWGQERVFLEPADSIAPDQQKTFTWIVTAPATPGTYDFQWQMMLDGSGPFGGLSQNVAVNVGDLAPPVVWISTPTDGSTVSGTIPVAATATDDVGVSRVQFYRDGALLVTLTTAPYSFSANTSAVANGTHTIQALAFDPSGLYSYSSTVTVTVFNIDTTSPTVSILSPAAGSVSTGTVVVNATAWDLFGVVRFQLQIDGQIVMSSSTAAPYAWDTATVSNAAHTITARAWDAAGNMGASTRTVTAKNPKIDVRLTLAPGGSPGPMINPAFAGPASALDPVIFSIKVDTAGQPDFPSAPSLMAGVLLPSGTHTFSLTRSVQEPSVFYANLTMGDFSNSDLQGLQGFASTVTVGGRSFQAVGQGDAIDAALGGAICEPSGAAEVVVMPGALSQDAQINIDPEPADPGGQRAATMTQEGLHSMGKGRDIHFVSSGTLASATLVLPYDPARLPTGVPVTSLQIAYFNPSRGDWELIGGTTPSGSDTVQATVTHFSLYAVVLPQAAGTLGLHDAYSYPNPAVAGQVPKIRAVVGIVDKVEVTIFDASGRLVNSGTVSSSITPTSGQYAGVPVYDYPWTGAIASGAYYAVVHAKAADGTLIKARVKLAVVR
jgi:hypothetical protein